MGSDWAYIDDTQSVVFRVNEDGTMESCLASREDVQQWVDSGGKIAVPTVMDFCDIASKIEAKSK